ncbi:gliding motility lipoprotein GldB [Mucilaginibacter arboris]|uniref:Gliding motility lipoprotein GldB n=1 Tax=Mucilaginibacter arboris TaxID=2682090 RepID=A0A7K1SSL9_9SPHI|nr:gliding motility lipoprotein GldB [Mucilaginibacter arboris]MVN20316.1 gliding motility lipoprotein GldB [Mucilaginibacter arboris]
MSLTVSQTLKKQIYLFFLICVFLASCKRKDKIDVSGIDLNVKIERFDHDFDGFRTSNYQTKARQLQQHYGIFYNDFIERILNAGTTNDTAYFANLRMVFKAKSYADLKHEVDSVYPNLDKQEAELTDAFKHIKYYYPQKKLPRVYAYFSGFQAQSSIGNNYFAIGLDLFLGADSKFYPALIEEFPHYISRRFTPDNMVPRVIESIAREDMFEENADDDKTLLSRMVYNGKMMYFMDQILPDVPDSTKIGYTNQQLKWCKDNEANLWGYFLEDNLLYESDYQKIQKYLTEAPFTPGLGDHNNSAPKLAVWTGWQIVKQYMDKNPKVSLQELMADRDEQKILDRSKYRPK